MSEPIKVTVSFPPDGYAMLSSMVTYDGYASVEDWIVASAADSVAAWCAAVKEADTRRMFGLAQEEEATV